MKRLTLVALGACLVALASLEADGETRNTVAVGIVWWPADTTHPLHALGSDLEACLTARIREIAPEVKIASQRSIRDALFPLLEPATQPASEQAFAAMLARDDVRARLVGRGLHYLIAFTGGTRTDEARGGGVIFCGAGDVFGGCFGYAWQGETTRLDAALWSLEQAAPLQHEAATVEGTSIMPAILLPVPLQARTQVGACRELGKRIAEAIRRSAAAGPG